MYHTILVPLDGSKRAEAILPHVEEMALRYEAKVVFVRVVEPPPVVVVPEGGRRLGHQMEFVHREEEAESYLTGIQGEFREKGIEAKTSTTFGPFVEEIVNAAGREGADLIALASHGRTGLSQVFYGSVAAGVLQRVDRPLLLIRSLDHE
jgi:nucleotide-binding universal stress UspA family protein